MLRYTVATDGDGGIIYVGMDHYTTYYGGMYGDLFFKKYTPSGNELFVKQITGVGVVDHLVAKNAIIRTDGEYF